MALALAQTGPPRDSPFPPVVEGSVLVEVAQEEPEADGLHPEDDEEEPEGGEEEELTRHPAKGRGKLLARTSRNMRKGRKWGTPPSTRTSTDPPRTPAAAPVRAAGSTMASPIAQATSTRRRRRRS
ncbi:immortalization up-regulated protein isoform X1 [Natator depressus]|uniref:immortalization up-regulated protein isoform X1 n=1 Tax=Natator depressus TaxID=27790 RepID=UPI003EBB2773